MKEVDDEYRESDHIVDEMTEQLFIVKTSSPQIRKVSLRVRATIMIMNLCQVSHGTQKSATVER